MAGEGFIPNPIQNIVHVHRGDSSGDFLTKLTAALLASTTISVTVVSDQLQPAVKANSVAATYMHATATDILFGRSSAAAGAGEEIACTAAGRALLDDADTAAQRTTLNVDVAGTAAAAVAAHAGLGDPHPQYLTSTEGDAAYQPLDSDLTAFAGLNIAADKLPYGTGAHTLGLADLTAAGRALIDDADTAAQRTTLGLVIGTNVQAYDAELAALAGLTSAADKVPYFTGAGTAAVADFTAAARTVFDDATVAAMRTTMGIGLTAPQGRPTLVTATPIMTSSQTAKTTVYFTPCNGSYCPIYDGTNWAMNLFSEMSQLTTDNTKSPAAVAASKVYDLFVWNDAGTLRCTRGPAWTSDTNRGTGAGTSEIDFTSLFPTNKVAITNGPGAGLGTWVGTIISNGSSQIDQIYGGAGASGGESCVLGVWSAYQQKLHVFNNLDTADSWTYTTATWRDKNNNAANRATFVVGAVGCAIEAWNGAYSSNSTTLIMRASAIGYDAANAVVLGCRPDRQVPGTANAQVSHMSFFKTFPAVGKHFVAPIEYSTATGTCTWYGDNAADGVTQSIFTLSLMA